MARDLKLAVVLQAVDRATRPIRSVMQGSSGMAQQLKASREALKGLQGQQRDISSFRQLKGAAQQTGSALQAQQAEVRRLSQQMAATANPTRQLRQEFQQAVRHAQRLKEQHKGQQQELQGLRTRLQQAGIGTRNLGEHEQRLRRQMADANRDITEQTERLRKLGQQQKRLAAAKASYEKTQALAGSMAAAGAAGVASGTGILYAGARFGAPGLEFDTTMSKVQALTRLDKNDEELAALRRQARELGATTMFSAGDAASGMAFLAMAGFTPKAIRDAMPGLLDMAKAGDLDLAMTADIASNILGGFRMEASQMGNVADILTKAFTTSNMSLEMLGETMKYVGPVASTAGMGLEEAAAMAGLLGNVGIQGSQAGTTLRAMLLRLAAPAGPAAKAMAKLGISAKDAQGNVRGITEVLGEVAKATEKMGSSDRLAVLKDIFGEEPAAGMAELINQSGAGGILKYLEIIKDHQGAAANTARVMGDNLAGDLDELSSAWDDVRIEVFEQSAGTLRQMTQALTGVIGRVGAWAKENPALVHQILKTVAGMGMLMAAGGGITLMLASILGPMAMVRYGMQMVGIRSLGLGSTLLNLGRTALPLVGKAIAVVGRALMTTPIGLAITAIAVAGLAILKYWQPVKAFFSGFWQGLMDGMAPVQEALGPTFTSLGAALAPLKPIWEGITSALGAAWEWASKLFQPFQATSEELQSATESGRAFGLWLAGLINLVKELPGQMFDAGIEIANGLVNGITSKMAAVKDAITGAASSAIGWFKETLGIHSPSRVFAELGGHTMDGLQQGIEKGEGGPLGAVGDISKRLAAVGALTLAASGPLLADEPIRIDSRAPLSPASLTASAPATVNNTYQITIYAAPGMDAQAIGQAVAAELDRRERARAARSRSSLHDQE